MTVVASWNRIRDWLAAHSPALLDRIGPPADEADLAAAEKAVGVPLPEDLLTWWRLADGADVRLVPPWFDPYPVTTALRRRETWIEVWHDEEIRYPGGEMARSVLEWAGGPLPTVDEQIAGLMAEPAGTPVNGMYLPVWLPIAGSGMGMDLFVDLRPGPLHGCVMQFDRVGTAELEPEWPSVTAMLAEIAKALESGNEIGDRHPVRATIDDDGRLSWE